MKKHPNELRPGDTVRHYRVVRRLGLGGYSCVFQMEHAGRPFTMKMATRPASGADLTRTDERAVREAVSLAHFRHPNLPRVLETGRWPDVEKGYFYLVTDYQPGRTFNQWRWEEQPSLRRLVRVLAEVARVLAELHEQGVIHRDFKADNLLILDEEERPVLIDFGAAYVPGAYPLTELLPPATLHNLPPECAALARVSEEEPVTPLPATAAMDLYAFGCLLHEALTDRHAFPPQLPRNVLMQAIEQLPPKVPCEVEPRAPESLSELTLRLLAKEPEQRPASARAVHEELLRLLEQEGDTEAWTVSYGFAGDEEASPAVWDEEREEPEPAHGRSAQVEQSPPAGKEEARGGGRRAGNRGRGWALRAVGLVLMGLVVWGLVRAACASAVELVCCGAASTALDAPMPTEKGRTPLPPSLHADDTRSLFTPTRLFGHVCRLLGACSAAAQLSACAGAPVRPDMDAFLQQCPPEALATAARLDLRSSYTEVFLDTGTKACPDGVCGAINIKTGPMGAWMYTHIDNEDLHWVTGEARVFPDRVYVQFDRIYLDAKWPTRGSIPSPFCAVVTGRDYYDKYGEHTFAALPEGGVVLDPARVDRSPDSAVINAPRVDARVRFPEGDPRNRRR
jgi:predicted Ser/Thr protein kinase